MATRALLGLGVVLLAATAALLAIGVVRHLLGTHGPVLPVSLCRDGNEIPLDPLRGSTWLTAWQTDWTALAVVVGLAATYTAGVASLRRRGQPWPVAASVCFALGLAVVVVATCGSIAVYDMALFSAHMLGHLALVMVAPPLLILGRPVTLLRRGTGAHTTAVLDRVASSRVAALVTCPPVALAAYAVVIVGTHLTGLMDLIMARPWAGQLEHLAYVLVGVQFFALVVGAGPRAWPLSMMARQLLLATAMAVDTFTGVILLQTTVPISMDGLSPPGLDPLAETRLGGAIMWVGGDGIMAVIMIAIGWRWSRRGVAERRERTGWLEQVRLQTFGQHVGDAAAARVGAAGIDDDDRAREGYNDWLRRLHDAGH